MELTDWSSISNEELVMQALYAELRKIGATVEEPSFEKGIYYPRVNGEDVSVATLKKGDKTIYQVGIGKILSSPRNAAYYILTEVIPNRKRMDELYALVERMKAALPAGPSVWLDGNCVLQVSAVDAKQLAETLKLLISAC